MCPLRYDHRKPFCSSNHYFLATLKKILKNPIKSQKRGKEMFSAATYSPTGTPRSTIGAGGLNFRVRHGTGCVPSARVTCHLSSYFLMHIKRRKREKERSRTITRARPRRISTGQLHASQRFHLRPISPVFSRTPYSLIGMGYLILKAASRLDAFSGYPFRT